jgi:hypothetical protein
MTFVHDRPELFKQFYPASREVQAGVRKFLWAGNCVLDPEQMKIIIDECAYLFQRRISETHVRTLAEMMRRETWIEKRQIEFAELGDKLIMINGYHRANGQILSGRTLTWNVLIHPVDSQEELERLYYTIDTNSRPRTRAQLLKGINFAEKAGISPAMARAIDASIPYIASGFSTSKNDRNKELEHIPDMRLNLIESYVYVAKIYEQILNDAGKAAKGPTRKRLLQPGAVSVALVTLDQQPEKAKAFWKVVASGLIADESDPRYTLRNWLLSVTRYKYMHAYYMGPALAWNAFYNRRPLRRIDIRETGHVIIDGTSFDGGQNIEH